MNGRGRPAYVRIEITSPVTGTRVRVVDLTDPDSEHTPGQIVDQRDIDGNPVRVRVLRWGSVCVEHDVSCPHERQDDARASADDPTDWCDECEPADPVKAVSA